MSWNVVDQVLSAASNFAMAIVVARSVSAAEFGAFSIAFMIFGIAVAAIKAIAGQPLQIHYSSADADTQRVQIARATGFVIPAAVVSAVCVAAVGLALSGSVGDSLVALAVVLPALMVQDTFRMAMFAVGRPAWAAIIDGLWIVVQFGGIAVLHAVGEPTVGELILAWGFAAAVSALVGGALLKVRPRISKAVQWVRSQLPLVRYLFPEYLLGLGATQVGMVMVGVVASANDVGAIRAAQVLMGPLSILCTAAFQFAVPEMASRPDMSSRQRTGLTVGISGVLGVVTIAYVSVLLLLPDSAGEALFGDSWAGASAVLLPMGLAWLASCQAVGPASALYAMGRAQWTFRIMIVKGPFILILLVVGAALWAAPGAAWANFLIELAVLPAWILTCRTAIRNGLVVTQSPVAAGARL